MTNRARKVAQVGVVLAVSGLAILGACGWYAYGKLTDPVMISGLLKRALGPALANGEAKIDRISISLAGRAEIYGLELRHGAVADKPLFKAALVELSIGMQDLTRGRMALSELRVADFEVNVIRAQNGAWNLPARPQQRAALELPDLPVGMIATAGAVPGKGLAVDVIKLQNGAIHVEDRVTTNAGVVSNVNGNASFDADTLKVTRIEGKLYEKSPVVLQGRATLRPELDWDLRLDLTPLDAAVLQEKVPFLNGLKQLWNGPWSGGVDVSTVFKGVPGNFDIETSLSFKQLSIAEPMLTRQTISIQEGQGKIVVSLEKGKPPGGTINLSLESTRIVPLDPGLTMPFDNMSIAVEFSGPSVSIKTIEGRLAGGAVKLSGNLSNYIFGLLDIAIDRLPINPLLAKLNVLQTYPWLSGIIIKNGRGKWSVGEIQIEQAELLLGLTTGTISGGLRVGPGGYEPVAVKGTADLDASLLAQMVAMNPSRLAGKAAIQYTLQSGAFTMQLRTQDLALQDGSPELKFRALAANINGLRQVKGDKVLVAWASNVRSGPFRFGWPELLKAAGMPLEGPIEFDKGEATVTYDQDGLHLSNLKCEGRQADLLGRINIGPDGRLSGDVELKGYSQPGVAAVAAQADLGGTLAAPVVTRR